MCWWEKNIIPNPQQWAFSGLLKMTFVSHVQYVLWSNSRMEKGPFLFGPLCKSIWCQKVLRYSLVTVVAMVTAAWRTAIMVLRCCSILSPLYQHWPYFYHENRRPWWQHFCFKKANNCFVFWQIACQVSLWDCFVMLSGSL